MARQSAFGFIWPLVVQKQCCENKDAPSEINYTHCNSTSLLLRNGKSTRRYRSLPLAMGENACLPALEESITKKDLIFAFGFSFLLLPMHSNKYYILHTYIHAYCTVKYLDQ